MDKQLEKVIDEAWLERVADYLQESGGVGEAAYLLAKAYRRLYHLTEEPIGPVVPEEAVKVAVRVLEIQRAQMMKDMSTAEYLAFSAPVVDTIAVLLKATDVHHRGESPAPVNEAEDVSQIEHIARVAHEVNRAYCEALGDMTQLPWVEAPTWQRDSMRDGVRFHLANPDAGPGASHQNWVNLKHAEGWEYGEEKDPEAKTHPCLVTFEELPEYQQVKDHLVKQIVHSLK